MCNYKPHFTDATLIKFVLWIFQRRFDVVFNHAILTALLDAFQLISRSVHILSLFRILFKLQVYYTYL